MLRHDTLSALTRIAALGLATVLLAGTPVTSFAHGSSRNDSRDRDRDEDRDHDRDRDRDRDCNDGRCSKSSQCDDKNPCTLDVCRGDGKCTHAPMAGCQTCSCDADCTDGNACTQGDCDRGVCKQKQIPGCTACTTDAGCNDGDACTTDSCQAGSCKTQPIAGCVACRCGDDCNDHNPCTTDQCGSNGTCEAAAIPGCVACTTAAECDDQNPNTTDACTGGLCTHRPVDLPPAEVCDDAVDNDHNGSTDCNDSACTTFPACIPPVEICGDCLDNDGDGDVDFEDTDCCANPRALVLKRVKIRPNPKNKQDRLKIRSIYTRNMPASFDPTKQDTTIQIADENGQIFCTTIAASHFMPSGQHGMAFWNGESFAGGLSDGRFTVKRNGTVKFRTHGHNARIRPTTGHAVRFTLRVGAHCSQTSMAPRAKKNVLLFP